VRSMVKATVLGLGLLTSGTALANNNFGGSPSTTLNIRITDPPIIMVVIRIGTITPDTQTIILATTTLMAILTMDGIREPRIPTGILSTGVILIRKPTQIGYPMSAGADRRGKPAGSCRRGMIG